MAACWPRSALHWVERALFVAGVVMLAGVYVAWRQAALYQIHARGELQAMIAARELPGSDRPGERPAAAHADPLLGYLSIPRLGLSAPILEGDDDRTLWMAAGHLPDSPLPWDEGNAAIAGHRDTFFRALEHVRVGDEVFLQTRHGDLRYRVLRMIVVGPDDVWVLTSGTASG